MKLSKRHGAASVQDLRDAGYLPAAMRNDLALLGWGADDNATLIPTEELVERFRVGGHRQGGGDLRREEAALVNGRYMREMPLDEYVGAVATQLGRAAERPVARGLQMVQEKGQTLAEVWPLISFLFEPRSRTRRLGGRR